MSQSCCGTCRFYLKVGEASPGPGRPVQPLGACRQRPPKVLMGIGTNQHGQPVSAPTTSWPTVLESEWCGSHDVGVVLGAGMPGR